LSLRATARIAALRVHPVKGCRALELDRALLTGTGIQWDREWMFVTEGARFLTQREVPGLARIDARVLDGELRLSCAGHPELRVPIDSGDEQVRVTIWSDTCLARRAAVDTREWLRGITGTAGQLVRAVREHARVSSPTFTGSDRGEVFFADAYALLVASPSSLADLNSRLEQPLPMNRFRPNVVLDGLQAFAEDRVEWLNLPLADGRKVRLKLVKPCTRCIVTTTDQVTGERMGDEPLRTLRGFRWLPALKGVAFGMNAIVVEGAGETLAVGDVFDVTWQRQSATGEAG